MSRKFQDQVSISSCYLICMQYSFLFSIPKVLELVFLGVYSIINVIALLPLTESLISLVDTSLNNLRINKL